MEVDGRFPSLSGTQLDATSQGKQASSVDRGDRRSGGVSDPGSVDGENVQLFMAEVSNLSDVRQSRVEALKQAIAQGTYTVDPHDVAGAMLSELLS